MATFYCGVFYRSPSSKSSVLTVLESTLKAISPNRLTSLTLLGDFNIHQRNPDHPLQLHLHSIQDKLNLRQVVSEPTRSTISTDTLLDPSMLSSCMTEPPLDGSDHNSLRLDLRLSPPHKKKVGRRVWLYKQANFESANNLLLCTPSNII